MIPLPPPPRRIRRTPGRAVLRALVWTLLTAVSLATLGLLLALLNELALRFLGRDVPAAVTSLHERPNSDGGYDRIARFIWRPARDGHRGRRAPGLSGGRFAS